MSSSDVDSADEMLQRAAAQQAAKKQQKQKAAEKKNQKLTKKTNEQPTQQESSQSTKSKQRPERTSEEEETGNNKNKQKSQSQPPALTQYEAWKLKHGKQNKPKSDSDQDEAGSDVEAEEHATSKTKAKHVLQRQQQRENAATAPKEPHKQRESKAARVPIKVERAKATRQADIDSGIAGALRDLALKKKQKQQKKKAKKLLTQTDSHDEEEEEEQSAGSDEENASDADSNDATSKPSATAASEDESDSEASTQAEEDASYDTIEEQISAYRERESIHVMSLDETAIASSTLDSDPLFYPITSFASLQTEFPSLPPALIEAATSGFVKPTPIQAQCWPILLGGKDVIGVASTGSGKTCAFILPAIFYILQIRERDAKKGVPELDLLAPRVLVLAPTRELAIQIHKVAADITAKISPSASSSTAASSTSTTSSTVASRPINTYVAFGGTSLEAQLSSMRSLVTLDLLVSTPGRLVKHLKEQSLTLKRVGYFVLDEADRMLDLGFEDALREISALIPVNRQTCLFSATWEASAQKAAADFLKRGPLKCIKVVVGSEDLTAAKSVKQIVEVIDRRQGKREKRLLELLSEYNAGHTNRILIFVLYKKEAPLLADHLQRKGWKVVSISGDRSQAQRLEALEKFRSGEIPILVATDVAARGLDIKNVTHVINFSLGLSVEQYIHRVGRCGRAGATGLAHTFIVDYDAPHTPGLVKVLTESGHPVSPELREMAERAERQAAKHTNQPDQQLKGDAYFVSLKKGALTKNVNLAKQLAKEAEEEEIEAKIFGEDDESAPGGVQRGKKIQHANQKKGGRDGGRKGGKGGKH